MLGFARQRAFRVASTQEMRHPIRTPGLRSSSQGQGARIIGFAVPRNPLQSHSPLFLSGGDGIESSRATDIETLDPRESGVFKAFDRDLTPGVARNLHSRIHGV